MKKRLVNACLALAVLASGILTSLSAFAIWMDPNLRPVRQAAVDEITARVDHQLGLAATADGLAARIDTRLNETPRNWLALDALINLAAERAIILPPDLAARVADARDQDFSLLALAEDCAVCAANISTCTLTTALVCKAPILLTPIEDLRGILQGAVDYANGDEVDQVDVGLSIIGLSASALAVSSGGSSLTVKAGSATVKLAKGMNRLSPSLLSIITDTVKTGIDWARVPAVRTSDDLVKLVRADAVLPLADTLAALGRTADALGPSATLHLLPLVDTAADATRLSRASQALGPRTVAAFEVLGKSRVFRATLRVTDVAIQLTAGLAGLFLSLGSALAGFIQTAVLRGMRHRIA